MDSRPPSPAVSQRNPLATSKNTLLMRSHGRPPWYDQRGRRLCDAFVIGIAGGSASGKTHVARQIVRSLGYIPSVVILSQDSFYKSHTPEELQLAFQSLFDFDHPDAIDMPMFANCLRDLKECKQTHVPVYSFQEHQRIKTTKYLYGAAIIIAEGILALHDPVLRSLYDLKVFVQCDSDLMLARRLRRDVTERGRDVEGILDQYLRFVKPAFDNFVQPTARYADIIVPGSDNSVAIDLISTHVRRMLEQRSTRLRASLNATPKASLRLLGGNSAEVILLDQTPQLFGIYTILRDANTSRDDFIFYADRLSNLIVEKAVNFLPYSCQSATTPTGTHFEGKGLDVEFLCGVSVLRALQSGGPLERGLQRVFRDTPLGGLLIQSDPATGEPMLLHASLPECIRLRDQASATWVLLLDAQIGTGASALMAIRVLLEHGVAEEHIIFLTFLVARDKGVAILLSTFPKLRIISGAIDDDLHEGWAESESYDGNEDVNQKVWIIRPGMGNIGDRYYM